MNDTGFIDDDNDTFVGNRSVEQYDEYYNYTDDYHYNYEEPWLDWKTTRAVSKFIFYVVYALGIPGNILSAIVWLRRHIATENSPAIYLAALAVNDLVFLTLEGVDTFSILRCYNWLCRFLDSIVWSTAILEPMLVLSFSVVRLIAIRRPLQVCYVTLFTFCVSRRRCKMYCGHARLSVCLSVRGRTPTLARTRM